MDRLYLLLAMAADLAHALAMILWALGLPLLFWHRYYHLARIYIWYGLGFTVASFLSHELIGECFLTTLARELRTASGTSTDSASFTTRLVEFVAGIRPSERWIVVLWQAALFVTTLGALVHLHQRKLHARAQSRTSTPSRKVANRAASESS